jgi:sporulation protein YtfJ
VADHPIQGLMHAAMENLKEMVDVNTIVGDAVETPDGHVIIPVSKVGFGFAAGGSDFHPRGKQEECDCSTELPPKNSITATAKSSNYPFGGGSGGGISITPVAFIVVGHKGIRLLNVEGSSHLYDRIMDMVPSVMEKLKSLRCKTGTHVDHAHSGDTPPPFSPSVD